MRTGIWSALVLTLFAVTCEVQAAPVTGSDAARTAAEADSSFAITLYHRLATTPGNLLFSPFSIRTALGMAYAGAEGNTATQIQAVLGFAGSDRKSVETSIGDAAKQLGRPRPDYTLAVADAMWGEKSFPFDPRFGNELVDEFNANLHRADFRASPEQARGEINRWVKKQTAGKIADLFPWDSIKSSTALVLADAVYFKADWDRPFEAQNTFDAPFHLGSADDAKVPTMHAHFADLGYADTATLQAVELRYRGGLAMVLIVPRAIDGLPAIEQTLDAKMLETTFKAMRPRTVDVSMPKLKLTGSFTLSGTLAALGMPDAFDMHLADFTGMIDANRPHPPLFIGQVFHRAVAQVDEKGTEAAAATGIGLVDASVMQRIEAVKVVADRPYLLLIRDPASATILFMGRVSDPK